MYVATALLICFVVEISCNIHSYMHKNWCINNFTDSCNTVPTDIVYHFYNLQNANTPVIVNSNNPDGLTKTHFNGSKESIFLVHGSGDKATGVLVQSVKDAIFGAKKDMNVVGIDWSALRKKNGADKIVGCGPTGGKFIVDFLSQLVKRYNMKYSMVSFVGHSLAGPFCSAVGSLLKGELKSIVGMDCGIIKKSDAKFVEVSIFYSI